jgi:hypothetical protein
MEAAMLKTAVLVIALAAAAAPARSATPEPCNLETFKALTQAFPQPIPIPDQQPSGVTVGPILSNAHPGELISDVVLEVKMNHTWVGDLRIRLDYDITCDGSPDAFAMVLCRPRGTTATTPSPCGPGIGFGCSGDLTCQNTYRFHDASPMPLGVGTCSATIASGCYGIPTDGGAPLSVFNGLPKSGCWFLTVIDASSGDIGSICEWTLWEDKTPPVGVSAVPWTRVKSLYR